MSPIHFTAEIGEDQTIHPPAGVRLTPGKAAVVVFQPSEAPATPTPQVVAVGPAIPEIAEDQAEFASRHNAGGLPPDLALNHDHYLHGAPKGIDQP